MECDNHYPCPSPLSKHAVNVTFLRLGRKDYTQSVKSKCKVIRYAVKYTKRNHLVASESRRTLATRPPIYRDQLSNSHSE